jgi:murein L,D-transpeptidase YcbB/YkuD
VGKRSCLRRLKARETEALPLVKRTPMVLEMGHYDPTEAALRQYQQKQGIPVSGAVDEATLKELQIELPASPEGQR